LFNGEKNVAYSLIKHFSRSGYDVVVIISSDDDDDGDGDDGDGDDDDDDDDDVADDDDGKLVRWYRGLVLVVKPYP
jgi:hypothetical protein